MQVQQSTLIHRAGDAIWMSSASRRDIVGEQNGMAFLPLRSNNILRQGGDGLGRQVVLRKTKWCKEPKLQGVPAAFRRVTASVQQEEVRADRLEVAEMCIAAVRVLIVDAVNNAKAGHPGMAMGMAPVGYALFNEVMKHNPKNPKWFNRDRFVLSAGHGCLLQYTLLHLTGYDSIQLEDLKQLTKFGSKTPGHPENTHTAGIEITTGPLGQGVANAVGLALAEKHLAARFNKPGAQLVDHYTYCIMGDGCAMEGISNESSSLAGHWGLGKLILFYDDNSNTIDGSTKLAFTEDVRARYEALGWHTQHISGTDPDLAAVRDAIEKAKFVTDRPSFIQVTTTIGYGSPAKQGTNKAHHGAFGEEEGKKIRQQLNWPIQEPFKLPSEVTSELGKAVERGAKQEEEWRQKFSEYQSKYPKEAEEFKQLLAGRLPPDWENVLPTWGSKDEADATRSYSEQCLNKLAPVIPGLLGGSADLATSNKVYIHSSHDFQHDTPDGRNIRYGIREHAMGGISNGLALHKSGLIPVAATFLVFTDYMRASIRLAALSEAGVIYVMTHDSIGVGEDGPTHQPVEHLISLRAIPNLWVIRPGDGNEVAGAYRAAVSHRNGPTLIALSRQKIEFNMDGTSAEEVEKGGYVVSDNSEEEKMPDLILLGTGSELSLVEKSAGILRKEGLAVRVVSMVCWELFEMQSEEYRESVLPPQVLARVSVEAGSPLGWREWIGPKGRTVDVSTFGKSGSYSEVFKKYGFTPENVVNTAKAVLQSLSKSVN